jgi:Xaa-Pro aminopeptidase
MSHHNNFAEFSANRERCFSMMPTGSTAIIFSSPKYIRAGDSEYPYCQNRNLFYLTGWEYPESCLVLHKTEFNCSTTFLTKSVTSEQAHWFGPRPDLDEIKTILGIDRCIAYHLLDDHVFSCLRNSVLCYIDYSPVNLASTLSESLNYAQTINKRFPHLSIQPLSQILNSLRQIKSLWEIDRIKEAIDLTEIGIRSIFQNAKSGMREYEIEAIFNFELHQKGCVPAFTSIIAAGTNATILHYSVNRTKIQPGELVLLDLGAEYGNYSADISRTFPIDGKFNPQQKEIYKIVLDANKTVIEAVHPGVSLLDLNEVAKSTMEKSLREAGILHPADKIDKYFTHHVSHMLGLYTHDVITNPSVKLVPDMVFTVEPGLYIPELNLGIRIEDNIRVTPTGYENLSISIPKEIDEIELLVCPRQ